MADIDVSDDVTIKESNISEYIRSGNITEYNNQRLFIMFSIPGEDKRMDEDEAPFETIR